MTFHKNGNEDEIDTKVFSLFGEECETERTDNRQLSFLEEHGKKILSICGRYNRKQKADFGKNEITR